MTELMSRNLVNLDTHDTAPYVELGKQTEGCILLTNGEPDFGISDVVRTNVPRSIEVGNTHRVASAGVDSLRLAIARFENRTLGLTYDSKEVLVTAGGSEALYVALMGILNPGDEVVIPVPALNLYESTVRMAGATPVFLDTSADDFQITAEKLAAAVTDKTKAIILNSPNNPTGVLYTQESLENVKNAVAGKPIFVLCDDVFNRVVYDGTCPSFALSYPELKEQILVIQSLSNTYAMAGFRIGYLMGSQPVIEQLEKLHATITVSPVSFLQDPAIEAVHSDYMGMVWAYDSRRKFLCDRLTEMGLEFVTPGGGFYVFPSIKKYGIDSATFCKRLIEEAKVGALPGICYGVDGYIRLSYSAPLGSLRAAMIHLENFIKTL